MRSILALALVAILAPAPAGAKTVRLVGDDFQSIVNQNPPGTTFIISAGEHRMQQLVPRDGDIFIGELGPKGKLLSTLNGSLLITNWKQPIGTYWVSQVQMIPGYQYAQGQCVGDDPDTSTFVGVCQYPEVLFKNSEFMQRKKCQAQPQEAANCVSQLDGPDQYFIAYDCPRAGNGDCDPSKPVTGAQVVYLLLASDENPNCFATEPTKPACPKLELAVTPFAFGDDLEPITPAIDRDSHPVAPNVTVKNLIVEKYANPGQFGAIGNHYPGYDWLVEGNEVRLNHGVGIKFHGQAIVTSNFVHDNGQIGITGGGTTEAQLVEQAGIVERNETFRNNKEEVGFKSGFEAGGAKFVLSKALLVFENYVHDNRGTGLWTDISNVDVTYVGNRVEFNHHAEGTGDAHGIFHEISFRANIFNNLVRYNDGSAIRADNSRDVDIHNNVIAVGPLGGGIQIIERSRFGVTISGSGGSLNNDLQYCTWHNTVHDNRTVFHSPVTGEDSIGQTGAFTDKTESFANCVIDPFSNEDIDESHASIPFFSTSRVFFSKDVYFDFIGAQELRWLWDGQQLTFCQFQAKGQEPGGRLFVGSRSPVLVRCR